MVVIGTGIVFKVMRLDEISMDLWLKEKSPKTKVWDMPMSMGQEKNEKQPRISSQRVRKKANQVQCPRSNMLKAI